MTSKAVHRCLHVLDLEKSLDFYEEALGLTEIRRVGPEDGSWVNVFIGNEASGFQLELTWNCGRKLPYDNGDRDSHIAFTVPDYEAALLLHEKMGCVCHVNEASGLHYIGAGGVRFAGRRRCAGRLEAPPQRARLFGRAGT